VGRNVRHHPHRAAAAVAGQRGRYRAALVPGLAEHRAGATTGTEDEVTGQPVGVHRAGTGVVDEVQRGLPADLGGPLGVLVHQQAGATDRGHVRVRGRVVRLRRQAVDHVVAVIAGGEVHADALGRGLGEDRVLQRDLVGRHHLALVAVGVADDVGDVVLHRVVQRVVDAGVAVLRTEIVHGGTGRHAVHGLDVQGLFAVPVGFATALVLQVERTEQGLAVLAGVEGRLTERPGVDVGVRQHGGRAVGVDDRDRHALAVDA